MATRRDGLCKAVRSDETIIRQIAGNNGDKNTGCPNDNRKLDGCLPKGMAAFRRVPFQPGRGPGIHMAIDTSDFRNGLHFYMDGEVWTIVEFQHVKPGKGGAFVRTRLRKAKTGQVVEKTFRSGEKVEPAFVEKRKMQFLYRQGDEIVMMDMDTFEQEHVPASEMGDQAKYMKEEMEVVALVAGGEVLGYEPPNFVELEVIQTDPGFKGDTVSGSTKPATVETGAVVQVPYHISEGDIIKIDTRTDEYLERVKR